MELTLPAMEKGQIFGIVAKWRFTVPYLSTVYNIHEFYAEDARLHLPASKDN